MSIAVITWVLEHSPTSANERLVLIAVADAASADGSDAYPSVERIAKYAHCSRRTAQRALQSLEAAGHLIREGVGPSGTKRWRVVMVTGCQSVTGATDGSGGVPPVSPEPPKDNRPTPESAGARDSSKAPEDFPNELRPHARRVLHILKTVAEMHGAKAVTPLSLGLVIMARPKKHHVQAAYDFASYYAADSRKLKDVVAAYRNWLNKCDDMAAPERMPEDGDRPVVVESYAQTRERRHGALLRLAADGGMQL